MLGRVFNFFNFNHQTRNNIVIGLNVAPYISLTILTYLLNASLTEANQNTISTINCNNLLDILDRIHYSEDIIDEDFEVAEWISKAGLCKNEIGRIYRQLRTPEQIAADDIAYQKRREAYELYEATRLEAQKLRQQEFVESIRLLKENIYNVISNHPIATTGAAVVMATAALLYIRYYVNKNVVTVAVMEQDRDNNEHTDYQGYKKMM